MEKLLKERDIREILGLGRSIIYRLMASGELPSVRVTRGPRKSAWRVRPEALEKFIHEREVKR
jgi:excisionase family DNA binding protein